MKIILKCVKNLKMCLDKCLSAKMVTQIYLMAMWKWRSDDPIVEPARLTLANQNTNLISVWNSINKFLSFQNRQSQRKSSTHERRGDLYIGQIQNLDINNA